MAKVKPEQQLQAIEEDAVCDLYLDKGLCVNCPFAIVVGFDKPLIQCVEPSQLADINMDDIKEEVINHLNSAIELNTFLTKRMSQDAT